MGEPGERRIKKTKVKVKVQEKREFIPVD